MSTDSPTGAPTLREALAELVALQDRSPGAIWPGVWERARAALSAQAPPSETVDRALNVFHEYAESQVRAGAHAPPAIEPTDAMIEAYLQANDRYWYETDKLPHAPGRWRTGNVKEATRVSLRAALAGTPQAAIGAQADYQPSKHINWSHLMPGHPAQAVAVEAESRAMFVARLEAHRTELFTGDDVLALLNDCDMLAHQSTMRPATRAEKISNPGVYFVPKKEGEA